MPSSPPATVVAISTSNTTIQVAWDEVPERDRNGIITMYEIQYWQSGGRDNGSINVTVGPNLYNLNMLESSQTYSVQVRAYTVVGAGPYSEPKEAKPDQEGRLSISLFQSTSS